MPPSAILVLLTLLSPYGYFPSLLNPPGSGVSNAAAAATGTPPLLSSSSFSPSALLSSFGEFGKSKSPLGVQQQKKSSTDAASNTEGDSTIQSKELSNEFDTGSFYFHGVDSNGYPTLWYRIERMDWDNIVLRKRMKYTDIVLSSALDVMTSCDVHGLNFVLLIDDFSPIQMLKHPRIGPAFFRSFLKRCPEDCLKRAIMVTGTSGSVFYNIVKSIAPRSFMEKITIVNSREEAANLLQDLGVYKNRNEIPSFLGGQAPDHPDEVSKTLPSMMSSLRIAMMGR